MPAIIRNSPYFSEATRVEVRGESIAVKRDQIVVWISVSEKGLPRWDSRIPKLPAILDPGCNHNLLINERHLAAWAGIHPQFLPLRTSIRMADRHVAQLAANVWLHRNGYGRRDDLLPVPPFELTLVPGIAVYPAEGAAALHPRLPLLGLRAFRQEGLHIAIDCYRSLVTIRTRRRYWWFG